MPWGQIITFSGQNLQTGHTIDLVVNGVPIIPNLTPTQLASTQLTVNEQNKFTRTGNNVIHAIIKRSNDQPISIKVADFSIGSPSGTRTDTKLEDTLYNPVPEEELTHMFLVITKGFLGIVGIWAVLFIIVGGFKMVMAQGNEEKYAEAKKTVTWAILGVIIAALSFSMVAIVQNLLQVEVRDVFPTNNNSTPK
jgi:hypothetical protein